MAASCAQLAKRALVSTLLAFASVYGLTLALNRDSLDATVLVAYRKVVKKVHPDKGGKVEDAQRLQTDKEAWDKARAAASENKSGGGRPRDSSGLPVAERTPAGTKKDYTIHAPAVLLTYHGFVDLTQWRRFVEYVRGSLRRWTVRHWCASLEATQKGGLHVHLMLQFNSKISRSNRYFVFEDLYPRADPHDLLGESWCRRKMQESIDRAMFYVYADKIGTLRDEDGKVCFEGNYAPVWVAEYAFRYTVQGRWPEKLWKARKLTHDTYETYLFATRDGVLPRKRNLEAVKASDAALSEQLEMEAVVKRIKADTSLFQAFPRVPAAEAWLHVFHADALRYPFLVVLGASCTGKTEWAKSLFKKPLELKVGTLEQFPDGMRAFTRGVHDALVLDDVRDLSFLVAHQEKLQGKYDARLEFGTTSGGTCAYTKWLFAIPTVITCNYATKNLALLDSCDFLGNPRNRVLVKYPPDEGVNTTPSA